jgi:hypothetical protein
VNTTCRPFGDQSTYSSSARELVRLIGVIPEGFTTNTSTAPPRLRMNAILPFRSGFPVLVETTLASLGDASVWTVTSPADDRTGGTLSNATNESGAVARTSFIPFISDSLFEHRPLAAPTQLDHTSAGRGSYWVPGWSSRGTGPT